jgi:hypothetical protein
MLIYELSRSADYSEEQLAKLIDDLSASMNRRYMDLYGSGRMNSDHILEKYVDLYGFFQNKFKEQFGTAYIPSGFHRYIKPLQELHTKIIRN